MKDVPPLPPHLEALLAPNRAILPLSSSVQARAIARAAAASTSPEPVAAGPAAPPRWLLAAAAALVVALGAGAYAARVWLTGQASPTPAHVARVASPGATESRPAAVAATVPESDAPAPPLRRLRAKASAAVPVLPTNAELQLLLQAHQDVTRGEFAGALAVIAEHSRRFRNGALVEEREALRVKSLAGLGRQAEAQRAAAEFHARFPHSVLLSTFERMTERER